MQRHRRRASCPEGLMPPGQPYYPSAGYFPAEAGAGQAYPQYLLPPALPPAVQPPPAVVQSVGLPGSQSLVVFPSSAVFPFALPVAEPAPPAPPAFAAPVPGLVPRPGPASIPWCDEPSRGNRRRKNGFETSATEPAQADVHRLERIFYHLCGECGKIRSDEYQRGHPIVAGEPIPVGICGRCRRKGRGAGGEVEREPRMKGRIRKGRVETGRDPDLMLRRNAEAAAAGARTPSFGSIRRGSQRKYHSRSRSGDRRGKMRGENERPRGRLLWRRISKATERHVENDPKRVSNREEYAKLQGPEHRVPSIRKFRSESRMAVTTYNADGNHGRESTRHRRHRAEKNHDFQQRTYNRGRILLEEDEYHLPSPPPRPPLRDDAAIRHHTRGRRRVDTTCGVDDRAVDAYDSDHSVVQHCDSRSASTRNYSDPWPSMPQSILRSPSRSRYTTPPRKSTVRAERSTFDSTDANVGGQTVQFGPEDGGSPREKSNLSETSSDASDSPFSSESSTVTRGRRRRIRGNMYLTLSR